jgi:hypothetical protein
MGMVGKVGTKVDKPIIAYKQIFSFLSILVITVPNKTIEMDIGIPKKRSRYHSCVSKKIFSHKIQSQVWVVIKKALTPITIIFLFSTLKSLGRARYHIVVKATSIQENSINTKSHDALSKRSNHSEDR